MRKYAFENMWAITVAVHAALDSLRERVVAKIRLVCRCITTCSSSGWKRSVEQESEQEAGFKILSIFSELMPHRHEPNPARDG
jgi:hypothetical protein